MDRCVGAAARLPESNRKDLAVQALARSATVSDLSSRHGVSRKFIYQQADKARRALDDAFISAGADDEVLFEIAVTKTWLRQVIVALALTCRGSYLGMIEFMRDLLGASISPGTVHTVLRSAAEQAGVINRGQDLSCIRKGLHDEIFQGRMPVLAGVCAESTYCYLLAAADHRDADTWGVHLLDAARQGLKPDYTIADNGQGLRAGQKAAWGGTPCMAMSSTSSASARASPTRCRASPKAPPRGVRSWRPGSAASAGLVRVVRLSANWRWRGRPKLTRTGWPATFEH